ncbi:MAG: hypothetical protein E6Q97_02375 [Desulfurellales bacterium]|nr:MAG: hypothetical protein E6Q97_02375 [Desulfurellales bacterium]
MSSDETKSYNFRLRGEPRETYERLLARVQQRHPELKLPGVLGIIFKAAEAEFAREDRREKTRK